VWFLLMVLRNFELEQATVFAESKKPVSPQGLHPKRTQLEEAHHNGLTQLWQSESN